MALQALGSLCSHTGKVRLWSSTRQGRGVDTVILDRTNCWDRVGPTSSSTRIIHRLEIPPLRRPRQHVLGTRSAPNRSLPKPLRLPTSEKRAGVDGVQMLGNRWQTWSTLGYKKHSGRSERHEVAKARLSNAFTLLEIPDASANIFACIRFKPC
jgi:hypothetical protein